MNASVIQYGLLIARLMEKENIWWNANWLLWSFGAFTSLKLLEISKLLSFFRKLFLRPEAPLTYRHVQHIR
jgi:hypothetical protein